VGLFSASEVTTLWRYTNLLIIIIIIILHRPRAHAGRQQSHFVVDAVLNGQPV